MSSRPNILFLLTDQQRFDTLGAMGNPVIRTPHLDALAGQGTAFRRAMVPAAECVPSRCCFTHGQSPWRTGCTTNLDSYPEDGRENLMEALSRCGYFTQGIGKYHFNYADCQRDSQLNGFHARDRQEEIPNLVEEDDYLPYLRENGFGHVTDPHGVRGDMYYFPQPATMPASLHPTQWVGDRAVQFLGQPERTGQPWYAFVSFIHPHPPFCPPAPWHKLYRDVDVPLPHCPPGYEANLIHVNHSQNRFKRFDQGMDLARIRVLRAYYYACISFVDYQVGRILAALEKSGQASETLVVFSSDHGELLGDFGSVGKRSYHDAASRVPLLVRWPGRVPEGKCCETPVSLHEVARTFLDVAGGEFTTHEAEGGSLVGFANQPDEDRAVFSQLNRGGAALYTATSRNWKYVYSAPDQRELLFDLEHDPGETKDLWDEEWALRPQAKQALRHLRGALLSELHRAGETNATEDGKSWRAWPKASLPINPLAGCFYQDHPWAAELEHIPGYSPSIAATES